MSNEIRELRNRTNLSQTKFAEYFDIPVSTLRKWEQSEAVPARYLLTLLAKQIPAASDNLEKIETRDGKTYYYDRIAKTLSDSLGNRIFIQEELEGVKRQNLPLYVKDLFEDFYEIQEKFNSDCRYDKKEDFIWS